MKINFEKIINKFTSKANSIYIDKGKVWDLLQRTKEKVQENQELRSIFDDIRLIVELIKDWRSGLYTKLSKNTVILLIISLIYLINPLDIIPDFIIGGFIDDAAVIAYILKKIAVELDAYKNWKEEKNNVIEINIFDDEEE